MPKKRRLDRIEVRSSILNRSRGLLIAGGAACPCALGPAGIVTAKREGDGATPRGVLPVRRVWRRADKASRPAAGVLVRVTKRSDGWCDATGHRSYNQLVTLPFSASYETLWRSDGLYDLVAELGWNDRPATPGRGSAIFLHAARPGFTPTHGCVALEPTVLKRLLARIGSATRLYIGVAPRKLRQSSR